MDLGIAGLGDIVEVATHGRVAIYNATRGDSLDVIVQVIDCAEPTFLERFGRERELLLSLSRSPRIVTIHDAGITANGDPYLLLDPTHTSLEDAVAAEGPMSEAEAGRILATIAEAVADAHLIGIVHRGVDPTAIRRTSDGSYQLTDFCLGDLDAIDRPNEYRAPEARRTAADRVGAASDVYALGATMLHAMTGKSPNDPDALDSVPAGSGRDLIVAAMDFDPARRPSSLELQRRLVEVSRFDSAHDPSAPAPGSGSEPVERSAPAERLEPVDHLLAESTGRSSTRVVDPSWAPPEAGPGTADPTPPVETVLPVPIDETSETVDLADILASSPDAAEECRAAVGGPTGAEARANGLSEESAPVQPSTSAERAPLPPTPGAPSPSVAAVSVGAELEAERRPSESAVSSDARAVAGPRYDRARQPRTRTELLDDTIWRVRSFRGVFVGMLAGAALLAGAYYVVGQRPTEGDDVVAATSTIATLVGAGSALVPVVGELDRDAATTRLDNAGFNVEVRWEFHPSLPRGQVVSSEPMSGESVPVGSTVSLLLSRGTEPSCVGATEAAARRQLEARGLKVAGLTRSDNDSIGEDLVVRCLIYDDTETAVIVVSDGPREPTG